MNGLFPNMPPPPPANHKQQFNGAPKPLDNKPKPNSTHSNAHNNTHNHNPTAQQISDQHQMLLMQQFLRHSLPGLNLPPMPQMAPPLSPSHPQHHHQHHHQQQHPLFSAGTPPKPKNSSSGNLVNPSAQRSSSSSSSFSKENHNHNHNQQPPFSAHNVNSRDV
jgi:hypothetical protein